MPKAKQNIVKLIHDETIIRNIHVIRGHKVMLDFDLAALYQVETKRLNEQVKRNMDCFPEEFMFRLTSKEWKNMMSQFATSSSQNTHFQIVENIRSQNATASQKKRNVNITPYAFTEHGVTMVANILKSERAAKMSVAVVRAFIQLKKAVLQYDEITKQLQALKQHLGNTTLSSTRSMMQ